MFKNFGLPTKYQWERIAVNTVIYFFGSFFSLLGFVSVAAAPVTPLDVSYSTLFSALMGAGGATLKFLFTLLFEQPQDKK